MITLTLPIRVVSESNISQHWAARRERNKAQQTAVAVYSRPILSEVRGAKSVKLTRIVRTGGRGDGQMMDDGNLGAAFKAVQDAIAKELSIDDGDIRWEYAQELGDEHGVRVEVST